MIPDPAVEPTLTVERAGQLVGLGRSAAYVAASRGELPTIHFGRRVVVPTAALRRLLGMESGPDREEGGPKAACPDTQPALLLREDGRGSS